MKRIRTLDAKGDSVVVVPASLLVNALVRSGRGAVLVVLPEPSTPEQALAAARAIVQARFAPSPQQPSHEPPALNAPIPGANA